MKKRKFISFTLISLLLVSACSKKENLPKTDKGENESTSTTKKKVSANSLTEKDWWEVPNEWKLKINSVTTTNDRNQFEKSNPEQVVIINYTYENLGYENKIQDLFIQPYQIIDEKGVIGDLYPATVSSLPQPTPVNAITEGAEVAFGLKNKSKKIKIIFNNYDSNNNLQKATFEIPISANGESNTSSSESKPQEKSSESKGISSSDKVINQTTTESKENESPKNDRKEFYELDEIVRNSTVGSEVMEAKDYDAFTINAATLEGLVARFGVPTHVIGAEKGDETMEVTFPTNEDGISVGLVFKKQPGKSGFGDWILERKYVVKTDGIGFSEYKKE